MDKAGAAVRLPGKNDLPFPHLPTMTPDSVHLLTRSSQMTLFRDEQGRVRRAYYGPRLREPEDALESAADAPLLYSALADSVTGLPNASDEYCICATQADGTLSLRLECQGWEVLELDDDREEAVFYGKDPSYPVRVEIHVRSHRESDAFLQWAVIRNEGREGIRLHRAASAQLNLRAERYFVTSFRGTWGGESLMSEDPSTLAKHISSRVVIKPPAEISCPARINPLFTNS